MAKLFSELAEIVDKARAEATARGYAERTPTPLRSEFWGTSLAPSSSEVLFREIEQRGANQADPFHIFTVQPCVRFADLGPSFDGSHLLHFHMFTCFAMLHGSVDAEVRWFLDLLERLGAPIKESYFTYFPGSSPLIAAPEFPDFGLPLLERMGIAPEKRVACAGLANYLSNAHRSETGRVRSAWGPRIEILADHNGAPVEYATFVFAGGRTQEGDEPFPAALSMVFGVERLAQIAARAASYWDLPSPRALQHMTCKQLFNEGNPFPFLPDIRNTLNLILAIIFIASADLNIEPGNGGVRSQLKRILQTAVRSMEKIALDARPLLDFFDKNACFLALPAKVADNFLYWIAKYKES